MGSYTSSCEERRGDQAMQRGCHSDRRPPALQQLPSIQVGARATLQLFQLLGGSVAVSEPILHELLLLGATVSNE